MIFKEYEDSVSCFGYDDTHNEEDQLKGRILKHFDGLYRFFPMSGVAISCMDLGMIRDRVKELNTSSHKDREISC